MHKIKYILIVLFGLMHSGVWTQELNSAEDVIQLLKGKDPLVDRVLNNREKYRFQFMLTPGTKIEDLKTIDGSTSDYFFPASCVKLPVAVFAIEKMERLGLSMESILKFNEEHVCGNSRYIEQSRKKNLSFRQLIEEMIAGSDNDHYNALYQFVGPEEINRRLKELGLNKTKIYKAFTGCSTEEQLITNSFQVVDKDGNELYKEEVKYFPVQEFKKAYPQHDPKKLLGSKHENDHGVIVKGAYDFNYDLEFPLDEMHKFTIWLISEGTPGNESRFQISFENIQVLWEAMRMFPSETTHRRYVGDRRYPDNVYKYFIHGEELKEEDEIITAGKIGVSYGFTTETAIILKAYPASSYFLSVSLYTNANDTVNDGDYEYESVARPFFARVSNILMEYFIEQKNGR